MKILKALVAFAITDLTPEQVNQILAIGITNSSPKNDKSRAIQLQTWEDVWEEYFKEKSTNESDEWRILWKLVA